MRPPRLLLFQSFADFAALTHSGIFTDGHDTQLDDKFATSVCITPGSTAEVQAIVKLANKHGVPISPISRGKNLGYGGRSPRLSGSIVVDLGKRMNQVLEINTTDYYCVVQPGVSYFQLYDEITKRGLEKTVMMDCPDLVSFALLLIEAWLTLAPAGLGLSARQHHGSRRRLHPLRRPLLPTLLDDARPPKRRGLQHGHGRSRRRQRLALPLQLRVRPVHGRDLHAVELCDLYRDGRQPRAAPRRIPELPVRSSFSSVLMQR